MYCNWALKYNEIIFMAAVFMGAVPVVHEDRHSCKKYLSKVMPYMPWRKLKIVPEIMLWVQRAASAIKGQHPPENHGSKELRRLKKQNKSYKIQ